MYLQVLEEPGEDSSRFDSVVPTVVRPPPSSGHLVDSEESIELGILRQFTFSSELQVRTLYPYVTNRAQIHGSYICSILPRL